MPYAIELVGQEIGKGKSPQAIMRWQVDGTEDHTLARSLILVASPITCDGLIRQNCRVHEEGGGVWTGDVEYGVNELGEVGDNTFSFEIGTQTEHITQAKEHVADYPAGATNYQGGINAEQDGAGKTRFEGTDVLIATHTWEETHYLAFETVASHAFVQQLEAAVKHVNDAPWRIWDRGEVLFLGASGAKRGEEAIPITYRFASIRSVTNQTIGDIIGIDKEGHHYQWVEYGLVEDGAKLPARPIAVHVERNYDYTDFSALGIGNDPWT